MQKSSFEQNGGTYRQVGDYLIPNLTLPPKEANIKLGKWGQMHRDHLINSKPVFFASLLAQGKLWQYLANVDTQAREMFDMLVEQMKEREGVTEQLKAENQMEWIRKMNNIQNRVIEMIETDLILNHDF